MSAELLEKVARMRGNPYERDIRPSTNEVCVRPLFANIFVNTLPFGCFFRINGGSLIMPHSAIPTSSYLNLIIVFNYIFEPKIE